jgi:hypothetical protein
VRPRALAARAAWIGGATAAAGAVTIATGSGLVDLSRVSATPKAIAEGKVWLLLTSGTVADRPWLPSLLGFALVGFAALSVARPRVVLVAALAGHVLATLAVYGVLGAAHAVDHDAFASVVGTPDFGLSAMIAAWIGVVSQVLWRRHRSCRAHVLNALGCLGCVLIGFAFRPHVTALDSEHLTAFAFGVAIAAWWPRRRPLLTGDDHLAVGFALDGRRDVEAERATEQTVVVRADHDRRGMVVTGSVDDRLNGISAGPDVLGADTRGLGPPHRFVGQRLELGWLDERFERRWRHRAGPERGRIERFDECLVDDDDHQPAAGRLRLLDRAFERTLRRLRGVIAHDDGVAHGARR